MKPDIVLGSNLGPYVTVFSSGSTGHTGQNGCGSNEVLKQHGPRWQPRPQEFTWSSWQPDPQTQTWPPAVALAQISPEISI